MSKLKKIYIATIITAIIYLPHHLYVVKSIIPPVSYLKTINSNEIPQGLINYSLQYFNIYSGHSAIKTTGYRPVVIKEISRDSIVYKYYFKERILGLAHPGLTQCTIYLNPDLILYGQTITRDTVIHEYLHCLGYSHVDNISDLMYYSSMGAHEYSLRGYGETIFWNNYSWLLKKAQLLSIIDNIKKLWNNIKN